MMITISNYNSAGIRAFARLVGAKRMTKEYVHKGATPDETIIFYRLDTGHLVADTNGDPLLDDEAEELLKRIKRMEQISTLELTFNELASVLAGLRLLEAAVVSGGNLNCIPELFALYGITHVHGLQYFEDVEPLSADEIDALCGKIDF